MKKTAFLLFALFGLVLTSRALTTTAANGGSAISADTAADSVGSSWTTLGPITLSEEKNGHRSHFKRGTNVTLGLQAPAGFQFNTEVVPNVTFTADRDIVTASAAFTRSNLLTVTFTVSSESTRDSLQIGTTTGLQVQPIAASPLASGNIHRPRGTDGGTAVIKGVTPASTLSGIGGGATSFGRLTEVAGAPTQLGILVEPSQNAVVNIAFGRQPVVAIQDGAGNVKTNVNGVTVTAARADGEGNLVGTVAVPTVNGIATFTNLAADTTSTITITFTSGELAPVTSSAIVVAPAPEAPVATLLAVQTQPSASNTAGTVFAQQPVIVVLDQYDLPFTNTAGLVVTAVRESGSGDLQGATQVEVVDGVATFTNLSHNVAGRMTIAFSAENLQGVESQEIEVVATAADRLAFETQPANAVFGVPFGVQPVVITTDAYGNFSTLGLSDSVPLLIALHSGTGTLTGSVDQDIGALEDNGVTAFSDLQIDLAGAKELIATAPGFISATSAVFQVSVTNQTIEFGPLADKSFGDEPFTVSATASSGLPVSFSIVSGPATVTNDVVTITGVGIVVVRASQSGNENYASAPDVEQSFSVSKGDQTISFEPLTDRTFGDDSFALAGTASSGLPVSFSIVSGPASITDNVVTIEGAGIVMVRASQEGDGNYNPAVAVEQSFTVQKASQSIEFGPLSNKSFGDDPFQLSAEANSGLPVTFSIVSGPATLDGTTVTITGAGTVLVRASQAGNDNFNAASEVEQSFQVSKATQTINFGPLENKTFGVSPFTLSATSSSGLTVTFEVVSGPAQIALGNTIALTGAGEVVVRALQDGNENFSAASVEASFTVFKADQTINFETIPAKRFGDAPFELSATASSGLTVTFSIVTGPATINGNMVTLTGPGEVTIRASQDGSQNCNPAVPVDQNVSVGEAPDVRVKSDLNGDLKTDVFFQNGARVYVWQMNGLTFDKAVAVNKAYGSTAWKLFGQADFNKDRKQDIVWQHTDGRLAVWYMNGKERVEMGVIRPIGKEWKAVAVCDMNNDTAPDLVFQNAEGEVVIRYLQGLRIAGNKHITPADAASWKVCGASDIDGDGSADLLVQHTDGRVALWKGPDYEQTVLLNDGKASAWAVVGTGDLNQDDKYDIVLRSRDGRIGVWTMDGAEKLPGRTVLRDGRRVISATVAGPR